MATKRVDRRATRLEELPNIGKSIAADLRSIGVATPVELKACDPFQLYEKLNAATGKRHDPCVLDTFISAVKFLNGAPAKPWWHYTPGRKRALARRQNGTRSI